MGGAFSKIIGTAKSDTFQQAAKGTPAPAPAAMETARVTAEREAGETAAATRKVRRAGYRSLLSEARINAEQGVSTLGSGPQL